MSGNDHRALNHEAMLPPEMLMPVVIINAAEVPFHGHSVLMFAHFVAFMLTHFMVLNGLMAFVCFVAFLMPFVRRFAVFTAFVLIPAVMRVAIMIVLGICRHRNAHSQRQNRGKTISNQFHQVLLHGLHD